MSGQDGGTREQRLKAALRDNLKRRKAQARGRESAEVEAAGAQATAAALPGDAPSEQSADRTGSDRR
ncbi:hypothetical protein FF100_20140 [Methylobacterium terricola]|uniref:Uncharacterized protein n=1 Tax=Methylobacterium terricola TaxID=2583531 RepID=A0A5C4LHG8_9HYPH|nr:hypothetical protein [Methylobacterium terricola]TNC11432.1 hypothetical protein FF100_20140 [Methylobacterium terricola]